jgi:predicted alpha/beta hydrolase family esterase
MLTIILAGYSAKNKDWAEEMVQKMNLKDVKVHEWRHWSGGSFNINYELGEIKKKIKEDRVNIIAKSVGVFVALSLIPDISSQINKVILCGIASVAKEDRKNLLENVVKSIPVDNILCIQNENDKFVKYKDAKAFYHSVDKSIKVISKPRSDHSYPYPGEFKKFLTED